MASPILGNLTAQVAQTTSVDASAKVLIDGFAARMQAAVDAALSNGATAEELAPVQAEVDALTQSSSDLAASVAANTPAARR
jgi:hypothetical protein